MNNEFVESIEKQPRVLFVVEVLKQLQERGLENPSIASGWTRGWLCNTSPTDIDIQYSGSIEPKEAQKLLSEILSIFCDNNEKWDIEGIWNTFQWKGLNPESYYRYYFVTSIDSVYLSVDGKLHDSTGFGFNDAMNEVLRMNDFTANGYDRYTDEDICYFCMRGCERIVRNSWNPTQSSIKLIAENTYHWNLVPRERKKYLVNNYLLAKISPDNWEKAKKVYQQYGWGFLFSDLDD